MEGVQEEQDYEIRGNTEDHPHTRAVRVFPAGVAPVWLEGPAARRGMKHIPAVRTDAGVGTPRAGRVKRDSGAVLEIWRKMLRSSSR